MATHKPTSGNRKGAKLDREGILRHVHKMKEQYITELEFAQNNQDTEAIEIAKIRVDTLARVILEVSKFETATNKRKGGIGRQ